MRRRYQLSGQRQSGSKQIWLYRQRVLLRLTDTGRVLHGGASVQLFRSVEKDEKTTGLLTGTGETYPTERHVIVLFIYRIVLFIVNVKRLK